jgi:hypothetical protein
MSIAIMKHGASQPDQTMEYIHAMLGELRTMAQNEGASLLAHLIDVASLEARDLLSGATAPTGRAKAPTGDQ